MIQHRLPPQPSPSRAAPRARSLSLLALTLLALPALAGACAVATEGPAEPDADETSPVRLEPVATFGCGDCDGPEQLSKPGVTIGPSGRVYVFDDHEPHVRVLEPDGSLAFTTGASGEGPGEIRMPFLLGVLENPDGSFWVHEGMFVHHYDAEGSPLESAPVPPRLPLGFDYDHPRGRIYMIAAPPPLPGAEDAPRRSLLRYEPGQDGLETVASWESVVGMTAEAAAESDARFRTLAVGPDGRLAIADGWNYRVRVLSDTGELLTTFGRPELPRPSKSAERLEREREMAARRGGDDPDPEAPHLGPWAAYDGAGRLWLHAPRQPGLFDVFSPEGTFLGEVSVNGRISESSPALSAHGNRLATVILNERDLPTVRLYRIIDPR